VARLKAGDNNYLQHKPQRTADTHNNSNSINKALSQVRRNHNNMVRLLESQIPTQQRMEINLLSMEAVWGIKLQMLDIKLMGRLHTLMLAE
jgi:hypothetical protein